MLVSCHLTRKALSLKLGTAMKHEDIIPVHTNMHSNHEMDLILRKCIYLSLCQILPHLVPVVRNQPFGGNSYIFTSSRLKGRSVCIEHSIHTDCGFCLVMCFGY